MRDASTGEYRPDGEAALAATDDSDDNADAAPQARDERFTVSHQNEHTEEPSTANINEWVEEYQQNPLLRVPTRLFVSDVVEPGYKIDVTPADPQADVDNYQEPTVPEGYHNSTYVGLDLSDALDRWLSRSVITGDSFDRDFRVILEHALTDAAGRRGAGLVEHVYDDPTERRRLLGLRAFKVEEVTAYTREGKAILLRPDDTAASLQHDDGDGYDAARAPTLSTSDDERGELPTTKAGKTAAFVQYDDIFGNREKNEVAFALDDVTLLSNDPDTGEIFGRPETASVVPRAKALRTQLEDVDQGLKNAAWNNLVANVDTNNRDEAKEMLAGLDPNSPESLSVTNTSPDIQQLNGEVPDITALIQQQVEYVVSGLPVPLYRVGFEGEINRDVTGEQSDDYQDQLARARRRLEATFRTILELKACEFLRGHAHPEDADASELYGSPEDVPDIDLHVRPDDETNPLRSEHFDADDFSSLMQGLKQGAPGGQVTRVLSPRAMIELIPGLDPDEAMPDSTQEAEAMGDLGPLDEADPVVRETFNEVVGGETAALSAWGDGDRSGVTFTNFGGDPFESRSSLESFLGALDDASDGPVYIGDAEWPAEDYPIHDRPVGAVGISESRAAEIYDDHADDVSALGGPKSAKLAGQYSQGDPVETPDGIGVVAERITSIPNEEALADADGVPDDLDASSDSPVYGVVTDDESNPVGFYSASELEATEIDSDVDPFGAFEDEEESEAMCPAALGDSGGEETAELAWSPPESWREAETPARLIALRAFASMGGKHGGSDGDGCVDTMSGTVGDADKFCAAFIDYIYGGYDYWRGDSFLPGD